MEMQFEKLGLFYLGREYDLEQGREQPDLLLYDSKDLMTHAVCVGMTGSGKTGLCLSLLEEAALDTIPAIAIDPKGDLGNLLLTFPNLAPRDFRPWIEESEATRRGLTPEQYAAQTAQTWREGLAHWGQSPERIARFRAAADLAIYTPGSSAGLPLSVLRSFAAPPAAVVADADALRERVTAAVSGLLALLGIDADPIRSREHILLSQLLDQAWRGGRDLDMAELLRAIQTPPIERVGFVDLETFFPSKDRTALAMQLNNVLASPTFAGWLEGEPLDIQRLLYTAEGRPRLSILSIAHLSDSERMFFVTLLLNEVLAWVRSQPGTSSLRALLYMDEIFGYVPPTANPPSKLPMLTLLKQARAYGLGVVLATQNPVDLDYKALGNTGTWFLGRLQTERDKARVLDGLEGASAAAGAAFDRQQLEATLAGLTSRVFLMSSVHEPQPVVFQTRWCLSYLRGPLTRGQISTLMAGRKAAAAPPRAPAAAVTSKPAAAVGQRPIVPAEAKEAFAVQQKPQPAATRRVYRPALLGVAKLHFVDAKHKVDHWQDAAALLPVYGELPEALWAAAEMRAAAPALQATPADPAMFAALPAALLSAKNYETWAGELAEHLYRHQRLTVWTAPALDATSGPDETEGEFRIRLTQQAREHRDLEVEKLRAKYATKIAEAKARLDRAEAEVARQKSQFNQQLLAAAINFSSSLLGVFSGRRFSATRTAATMRSATRSAQEHNDIGRAKDTVETAQAAIESLEATLRDEVTQLETSLAPERLTLEAQAVRPRKSEVDVERVALVWLPWRVDETGIAEPLF